MHSIDIAKILSGRRFDLTDEKALQDQIKEVFDKEGVSYVKEAQLSGRASVIDFKIGTVGVEVKIKGNSMDIYKQLERYLKTDHLTELLLVTNKSMGVPGFINHKPVYVLKLGNAWL